MNFTKIKHFLYGPEIAIFHEFHKPPYGGGNTFLLALEDELLKRGFDVGRNRVGSRTRICLFNSYNFDFDKLRRLKKRYKAKMVHRVDGPIGVYRGKDTEVDKKIWEMNHELADITIFQSEYSLNKHKELGLDFKNPRIITNASNPLIFHTEGRIAPPDGTRKIRLINTVWSDNPKKGGPLLAWLDEHLDYNKYEMTFVGRTKSALKGAKMIEPVPSEELGKILREHDIFIAPSEDDPCSNALIEALTSGLPAAYLKSGGHPELVKAGGVPFTKPEEMIPAIEEIASHYEKYQKGISNPSLSEVAGKYIEAFNS